MTVLERLVRKGKLTRRKAGRTFLYTATESRDSLRRVAIRELLDGFFDGSAEELIQFLRRPETLAKAAVAGAAQPASNAEPSAESHLETVLL